MRTVVLFISAILLSQYAHADACDDYNQAVNMFIHATRQSSEKLDGSTNAHEFAEALNLFISATEELTATLRRLTPEVTTLYQSHSLGSLPVCDQAQERLVAFAAELNSIGAKFGEKAQKYIADPEVQKAFEHLRSIRFESSKSQSASQAARPKDAFGMKPKG
jgi:ABC-type transporter Mla subunit MlaD